MKVALSEIKKNLQGNNSGMDEAKNKINDLEHNKQKKNHSIRTVRKKRSKKKQKKNQG